MNRTFDTMLSRDIQQMLDHFRRAMDQAFSDCFAPAGLRGTTPGEASDLHVKTGWNDGGSMRLPYGKFYRAIDLPNGLDQNRVQCRSHDGVLDVQVPIVATMKPQRILIEGTESRKVIAG